MQKEVRLLAVIIGINHYQDALITNLHYACSDAELIFNHLNATFAREVLDIVFLKDEEASLKNVRTQIGEVVARKAQPNDIVLIYFAGHGSPETDGTLDNTSRYLVLHDTQYENIFATGLDLEEDFRRLISRIRSQFVVIFIDACFSGRAGGRTFEGPHLHQIRHVLKSGDVHLNQFNLGEGRIVITACDDSEVAIEDHKLGHGIFTYCLVKTLVQDIPNQSAISIPYLYDEVATQVSRMTNGKQHPIFNGRGRSPKFPYLKPIDPNT